MAQARRKLRTWASGCQIAEDGTFGGMEKASWGNRKTGCVVPLNLTVSLLLFSQ